MLVRSSMNMIQRNWRYIHLEQFLVTIYIYNCYNFNKRYWHASWVRHYSMAPSCVLWHRIDRNFFSIDSWELPYHFRVRKLAIVIMWYCNIMVVLYYPILLHWYIFKQKIHVLSFWFDLKLWVNYTFLYTTVKMRH